jgi:putative endonuclease
MSYFVYILRSQKDGSYYIGSTQGLAERVQRHNQGRSLYTKARKPWIVVYSQEYQDRAKALKREKEIKSKKKKGYIESLVRASRP